MSDGWRKQLVDPNPWVPPNPLPPAIETSRTMIRGYGKDDGQRLFAAINSDRQALLPWMVWPTLDHLTVEDSIYHVERIRRATAKDDCRSFSLGAFNRGDGSLLGEFSIMRIDRGNRCGELGYWIRGDAQRKGIGTEVVGNLISSALTAAEHGGWGLRRITVFCDAANLGSKRLAESLGLRLEVRTRQERYCRYVGDDEANENAYRDCLGYAVLADEWDFDNNRARAGIAWD